MSMQQTQPLSLYYHSMPPTNTLKSRAVAFLLAGKAADGSLDTVRQKVTERVTVILQCCNVRFREVCSQGPGWDVDEDELKFLKFFGWDAAGFWSSVFSDLETEFECEEGRPFPYLGLISLVRFILDSRRYFRRQPGTLGVTANDVTRAADDLLLDCFCAWNKHKQERFSILEEPDWMFYQIFKPIHGQDKCSALAANQPAQTFLAWQCLVEKLNEGLPALDAREWRAIYQSATKP
ncbi:hypothetical protein ACJZ2D_012665 [Fusarium nematophilum]